MKSVNDASVATKMESLNSTELPSLLENTTNSIETSSSESNAIVDDTITSTTVESTSQIPHLEIAKRSNGVTVPSKHEQKTSEEQDEHADFTNSNVDFQRYKPNRRRILTKPETHTYIQKIFG